MQRLMRLGIRVFVPRHRIGATLIAFNEQDEILMLRHVFHPHAPWGPPGGWMGRNESPETCLVREVREETGLDAIIGPVIHAEQDSHPHHVTIAYMGETRPGPITLSEEILEARWFAPDDLPEPLYNFVREAIRRAVHHRQLEKSGRERG